MAKTTIHFLTHSFSQRITNKKVNDDYLFENARNVFKDESHVGHPSFLVHIFNVRLCTA